MLGVRGAFATLLRWIRRNVKLLATRLLLRMLKSMYAATCLAILGTGSPAGFCQTYVSETVSTAADPIA